MMCPKPEWLRLAGLCVLYLAGTVGILASGDSDGGNGNDDPTYTYNITSANFFTGGEQIAVVRYGISGSCANVITTTATVRVGAAPVVVPGSVSITFTTSITPPIFESVYIDNDASGNLNAGDRVWGDDPNSFFGYCFDSLGGIQNFDWETESIQIQTGLGLTQPSPQTRQV